jgi:hypothetical protein
LPPSSQEIEELIRETSFEEDYAKEDILKNEKILEFLLSYMERNHCHFLKLSTRRKPKESFYRYFCFTGVKETTSCLHDVGLELNGNIHEK